MEELEKDLNQDSDEEPILKEAQDPNEMKASIQKLLRTMFAK